MRDEPAQHGVGVLDAAQVAGAVGLGGVILAR